MKNRIIVYLMFMTFLSSFSQKAPEVIYQVSIRGDKKSIKKNYHSIGINEFPLVYGLSFDSQNLRIPNDIDKFPNLYSLLYKDSELSDFLPQSIFSVIKLNYIEVSDTRMRKISREIENAKKLEKLIITASCIDSVPREVFELPNLKILDLSWNQIEYIDTNFNPLKSNIERIYLQGNFLNHIPSKLLKLPKLQQLFVSYNSIDTVRLETQSTSSLHSIYLDHNKIKSFYVSRSQFKNLAYIHIINNPLEIMQIDSLSFKKWSLGVYMSLMEAKKVFNVTSLPATIDGLDISNQMHELTEKEISTLSMYPSRCTRIKEKPIKK